MITSPQDIQDLEKQIEAAGLDARALVAGLDEEQGNLHSGAGSWSVAECLDHLAITNRVYLGAMEESAIRARRQGMFRRSPATPGYVGRLFVGLLEPPVKVRMQAPTTIRPGTTPPLADAFARL